MLNTNNIDKHVILHTIWTEYKLSCIWVKQTSD